MEDKDSRFEYWLKRITLIVGTISGIFAFIPQASTVFGPFDYAAEMMLIIFVIGIVVFAVTLIYRSSKNEKFLFFNKRVWGIALIIIAPLIAFVLWFGFLRIPQDIEEKIQKEISLGDTYLNILNNPHEARNHYRNAAILAPRRGSIKAKIQDAEERIK